MEDFLQMVQLSDIRVSSKSRPQQNGDNSNAS